MKKQFLKIQKNPANPANRGNQVNPGNPVNLGNLVIMVNREIQMNPVSREIQAMAMT